MPRDTSMLDDILSTDAPAGFEPVIDVNERVQSGDMFYDRDDHEWCLASRIEIGRYISQMAGVCRPFVEPTTTIKRMRRTRR